MITWGNPCLFLFGFVCLCCFFGVCLCLICLFVLLVWLDWLVFCAFLLEANTGLRAPLEYWHADVLF